MSRTRPLTAGFAILALGGCGGIAGGSKWMAQPLDGLNRSLVSHRIPFSQSVEKTLQNALTILRERESLPEGARLVVISDILAGSGIDSIQIRSL